MGGLEEREEEEGGEVSLSFPCPAASDREAETGLLVNRRVAQAWRVQ